MKLLFEPPCTGRQEEHLRRATVGCARFAHDRATRRECYVHAELSAARRRLRDEVLRLGPRAARARIGVGRATLHAVGLVRGRTDDDLVPFDRDRAAEPAVRDAGCRELLLECPARPGANKNVCRALRAREVQRVAIRPDDRRIAGERHGHAERVGVGTVWWEELLLDDALRSSGRTTLTT